MATRKSATTANPSTAAEGMAVTGTAGETATEGTTATAVPAVEGEFRHLPIDEIIVEKQIRTGAGMDDKRAQGLVDSVAAKGVLEPVLVVPREDKFVLLAGELRYWACKKLGLTTIPARILPNVQPGEEVLTIQLIENLQRCEIDPIDKANAILTFFQCRHEGMDLDTVINNLILCDRADQRVPPEIVATVATISGIVGTKTRTLQNILSLLKLPQEIQNSVKGGDLPVSQGYILASHIDNPGLMTVFQSILKNPVTNKQLTELLSKADQATTPEEPPSPFQSVYTSGQTLSNRLLDGKVRYDLIELENLHLYFLSLIEVIERAKAGGGTAKAPDPPAGTKKKIIA